MSFNSIYRGLPAEIRLMIFRLALQNCIPSELVFGRDPDRQIPRSSQYCRRPMLIVSETPCLPEHTLAILQLNRQTRAEAYSVLPTDTTLDLANLRRPLHLTEFLEGVHPLVHEMTSRVIIDKSYVQLIPEIWVTGASRAEIEELDLFIDNLPHLDSLIYVIDAAKWQGSTELQKRNARMELTLTFDRLWREDDMETMHSRIESGRVRIAKLYVTLGRLWHLAFLASFKNQFDPLDRLKVVRKCLDRDRLYRVRHGLGEGSMDEDVGHSFLQKFRDTDFMVITLTKR